MHPELANVATGVYISGGAIVVILIIILIVLAFRR